MPVTKIASKWDSGNLIFHETASRADTHNVFTLAPGQVTVGNADNDVDFKVHMGTTGESYALFDCALEHVYFTGLSCTLDGDLDVEVGDISLVDDHDLEFGSATNGDVLMRFATTGDTSNPVFVLALDDTSQQMHITDKGAVGTDWGRTAGTNPELAIHSETTPISNYLAIGNHDGTTAHIDVAGGTTLSLDIAGTPEVLVTADATYPATDVSNALGITNTNEWTNLYLGDTGVIGWNNSNCAITHATGVLTVTGDIVANDDAGPAFQDEAAAHDNPTLCPNKADLTLGIGWAAGILHLIIGGVSEVALSADALYPNADGGNALGITDSNEWANLYLVEGGVIGWNNSNCAITHAAGILTVTGDISASNGAGPSIQDVAATNTVPTLIPNKADLTTGIGWQAAAVHIIVSGGDEFSFTVDNLVMNGNGITGLGAIGLTGAITISPTAPGTFIDFELETEWTGGTLIDADFGGGTVQDEDAIGMFLDFAGGGFFPGVTDLDVTGYRVTTAALTQAAANTTNYIGFDLPTAGALVNSGTAINWRGVNLQLPAIEQTSGTIIASGVYITGAAITTGGTLNGILLTGNMTTGIDMSGGTLANDIVLQNSATITNSGAGTLTITEPLIEFVGAVTGDTTLTVTSTDATAAGVNAILGENAAGAVWTSGNQVGVRGRTTITGSNNFVSATGVWAGLVFTGATGSGSGLTCALNAEASSNNSTAPNSVVYIQSLPGASADFSNTPYLVFSETRGGTTPTGSRYLFEVGHQHANTVPTIGTGELYFGDTLQIAVNLTPGNRTNRFIPLSSLEASYTTAYPIVSTYAGTAITATLADVGGATATPMIDLNWTTDTTEGAAGDPILGSYAGFNMEACFQIGDHTTAAEISNEGSHVGILNHINLTAADAPLNEKGDVVANVYNIMQVDGVAQDDEGIICCETNYLRVKDGTGLVHTGGVTWYASRNVIYVGSDDEVFGASVGQFALIDHADTHSAELANSVLELTLNMFKAKDTDGDVDMIRLGASESTQKADSGIFFEGDDFTYAFRFGPQTNGANGEDVSGNPADEGAYSGGYDETPTGYIKVNVNGLTKYIYLHTDVITFT